MPGATSVVGTFAELESNYACPAVAGPGLPTDLHTDGDIRLVVMRYLARAAGTPIRPTDTASAYPLVCGVGPQPLDSSPTLPNQIAGGQISDVAVGNVAHAGANRPATVSVTVHVGANTVPLTVEMGGEPGLRNCIAKLSR